MSRRQIAYLNLNNVTEENLVDATTKVINAYNKYELPRHWAAGNQRRWTEHGLICTNKTCSLNSTSVTPLMRGIRYYLVSGNYIVLFSRFIHCGVREAVHLIVGLMEYESDIQPEKINCDTHAQSTVVFGLAHLLGIKLMPRIKDINSLVFFKPDGRLNYDHIDSLISDSINFNLIHQHYREMLRIVISIKPGKVSASTIIRRLGSEGIRSSLFYAFRELGSVVRTQFLLEYIQDIEMRETVHTATCKSEEFNNFLQWVFFYNNGMIQENLQHEQARLVKYNHLVANLVILHNVNAMSKVLKRLACFNAVVDAGCSHQKIVCGGGRASVEEPEFYWVNTILGNLKSSIRSTYHSIGSQYAQRYLSEFQYRFNRRFNLSDLIPRLAYVALRTAPMPEKLLKIGLG